MKNFFKRVLFNIATAVVTFGILTLLLIVLVTVMGSGEPRRVEENSVLVLDLGISINDSPGGAGLNEWLGQALGAGAIPRVSLRDMLLGLETAAEDSHITALVIKGSLISDNYGSGYAALREVRAAIEQFRLSGKRVYVYTQAPAIKDYYLVSGADEIHLNPAGLFQWNGLATEGVFLSDFLQRNGIRMHVFEAGEFKGATDMFKRDDFSVQNREQLQRILEGRWNEILNTVVAARSVTFEELRRLSEQVGLLDPNEALQAGLVDAVSHYDQFLEALEQDLPGYAQITFTDYLAIHDTGSLQKNKGGSKARIGVVYMEGDIMIGETVYPVVGGDSYSRAIREMREDPLVKAVVLRINSPGGAAYAGDQIAREVELTSKEKPVVVSFGALAASAGYLIAAPANVILTEPTTLTGSIGAFLMFPDMEQLGLDYGVHSDSVMTGPLANLTSILKQPTARERVIFERFLDNVYQQFLNVVEKGRKLSREELGEVAEGRLWSGREAVENGLADRLGGLQDAIQLARELAGVNGESLEITEFPTKMTGMEWLEELFGGSQQEPLASLNQRWLTHFVPSSMQQAARSFLLLTHNHSNGKVYARLPFWLE